MTDPTTEESAPVSEVAVRQPARPVAARASMPDKIQYARALAEASLLPRAYQKQPGNVLLAVEMGEALGVHPFVAIQGVHVIEGKPSASAGLISSLVRRAGHRLRVTGDDTQATAEIVRSDDPDFTYRSTWTMDRADLAGLADRGAWKTYPAAMLKARAITEVARDACQEALNGIQYTPEELGAVVDGDGEYVDHQPVTYQPVAVVDGRDWFADVALCQAVEDCRALYKEAKTAGKLTAELAERITDRANDLADPAVPTVAEPATERSARMMTRPQQSKMMAGFGELNLTDRDDRLAFTSEVIGRDIASSSELTADEAKLVIDQVEARLAERTEEGDPA